MSSAAWHLEQLQAKVQWGRLSASIDLTRPDQGLLVDLSGAGTGPADARILGVAIPGRRGETVASGSTEERDFRGAKGDCRAELPAEGYARGADLVAVYEESESWPVRLDALWTARSPEEPRRAITAVDLVLSVQTSLLASRPELAVCSTIPAVEVVRLGGVGHSEHQTLTLPSDSPLAVGPAEGPCCLVFRPTHGDLSYAEMVHPADAGHTSLQLADPRGELVRVAHRLFEQPLEKGVVLRARVRGVWLPRHEDTRLAARQCEAFAAADPPLGA